VVLDDVDAFGLFAPSDEHLVSVHLGHPVQQFVMGYTRLRYTSYGDARYTAYYWDLLGRQRSAGTFARQRDAERTWRRAEAQIADGKFVNLACGRQRFPQPTRRHTPAWVGCGKVESPPTLDLPAATPPAEDPRLGQLAERHPAATRCGI
jgi:hypothetical protein